jgi:hypothetical protein
MNKLILILLLPVFLFGQGADPSKKIQTFNDLYTLTTTGGFIKKATIPQTFETATVLDAKNYLFLEEGLGYPIYSMTSNRLVPRYALTPKIPVPVLTLTGVTSGSLTFSWTDPIGGAGTAQIRYVPDFEYGLGWSTDTQSPTPPRTINGLLPTTTYYAQVQLIYPSSIYPDVYGEWSNMVIATTGAIGADNSPTAPYLSGYPTGNTTASLSWTAATDDIAITGYRINRWINVLGFWTALSQVSVGSGTLTYNATGLLAGQTYRYMVEALDSGGHYTASNYISLTTSNTIEGDASITMNGLVATTSGSLIDNSTISLTTSWDNPTVIGNTSVTSYEIRYYDQDNLGVPLYVTGISSVSRTYTITGMTEPIYREVSMRARGTNGIDSPWVTTIINSTYLNSVCPNYGSGVLVTGVKNESNWEIAVTGTGTFRLKVDPYGHPAIRARVYNKNGVLLGDTKYIAALAYSDFIRGYGSMNTYEMLTILCGVNPSDINLYDYTGNTDDQNILYPNHRVILEIPSTSIVDGVLFIKYEHPLYSVLGRPYSFFVETDCP